MPKLRFQLAPASAHIHFALVWLRLRAWILSDGKRRDNSWFGSGARRSVGSDRRERRRACADGDLLLLGLEPVVLRRPARAGHGRRDVLYPAEADTLPLGPELPTPVWLVSSLVPACLSTVTASGLLRRAAHGAVATAGVVVPDSGVSFLSEATRATSFAGRVASTLWG